MKINMKRPLAAVCLLAVFLVAAVTWLHPAAAVSYGAAAGEEVCLTGHVYAKEYKGSQKTPVLLIYIKPENLVFQNEIFPNEAIPFYDNFICILQEGEKEPTAGSLVTVRGVLREYEEAANPGQFDERSYYAQLGVSACITRARIVKNYGGKYFLRETLWQIKVFLGKGLERIFSEQDAALLKGMLLGDRSAIDAETKTLYKEAGIMHIFAVSGLHVTLLGMGLYALLRKAYLPVIPAALSGIAIMILYGMMIGLPVSAVRAIGMFVLRLLAECLGRTYDMLTALVLCAAAMVIGQPLYLNHAGFLLSFSAVCGAAVLKPAIQPEQKLPPLLDSFFLSFAITVFTLPVQLYFYYEAPVYAVLLNLAVIPLAGVALALGAAALVVSFLFPQAAAVPAFAVHLIFASYEEGSRLLEGLPYSRWTAGRPALWQLAGFYLLVGVLLFAGKLMWKYKLGLLCGALLIFTINGRTDLRVTFLAVGQGDCVCMELPDGSAWLYDGGSTSISGTGAYRIEPFLKSRGITRLDGIFVSHSDADHVNGVEELLASGKTAVGLLILPCTEKREDGGFSKLLSLAEERHIPVLWLEAGMEWENGGVHMLCLHPAAGFLGEDANAASSVLYIAYGGFSMLLTGDVEGAGEEAMLQSIADAGIEKLSVLKVAHHGSKYATGERFLEALPPNLAVISAGRGNVYGHPHRELLERLAESGAAVMVTYETGAVMLETDGKIMRVKGFLQN